MNYIFAIDPNTGLPALPEGQLWRVVEKTVEELAETGNARYEIQLIELQPDTKKTKTRYEPYHWSFNWINAFWGGRGRAVKYTLTVNNGPLVLARRDIGKITSNERPGLTQAAIKFAAEELLRGRAHRKYVKSLLGDYPPNALAITTSTEDTTA